MFKEVAWRDRLLSRQHARHDVDARTVPCLRVTRRLGHSGVKLR